TGITFKRLNTPRAAAGAALRIANTHGGCIDLINLLDALKPVCPLCARPGPTIECGTSLEQGTGRKAALTAQPAYQRLENNEPEHARCLHKVLRHPNEVRRQTIGHQRCCAG